MKNLKMGTPLAGVVCGLALVAIAALVMLFGFWKVLLLVVLFAIGYFVGTVENKQEFIKDAANRIIPAKEAHMIDIKSEIARDPEARNAAEQAAEEHAEEETAEEAENEDGE
jgi:uncharacterized membrane protein